MSRNLLALLLSIFCLSLITHPAAAKPFQQSVLCGSELQDKDVAKVEKRYAISVPVANVWRHPSKSRSVDAATVISMPQMAKWTKSLTVAEKNGLIGRLDTQALYGDEVTVLKTKGDWIYIAIKDQKKPGKPSGYVGWVSKVT